MTDTDIDVDGDVMFGDDEEDDAELDFENLLPPDGVYEVTIKDVSYRDSVRESDGVRVYGLNIRLTLVDPDGEFDGTLLSKYLWLGNDKFTPQGRKQMKALCDAVGVPCEGSMKISDFGKTKQTIGRREETVLSAFSGLSCGAFLKTKENEYNGQINEICEPVGFITLERLAEIQAHELGDPDF